MPSSVIVWDIETVPDLRGFAAANGLLGRLDDEVRAEIGDKFPKLIYHSIACIGALVAQRQEEHWAVCAIAAPNIGERSEREIISAFVNRIAHLAPQLVTFNGAAFDLPVLRYRAMVCGVAAPGLAARPYFNRYSEDAIDLCDVLSSFSSQNKISLHELCRVMGLPGMPDGMGGADVERYCREGRVAEVAAYCVSPGSAQKFLSTRRRLQHLQRPTPSRLRPHAPRASCRRRRWTRGGRQSQRPDS